MDLNEHLKKILYSLDGDDHQNKFDINQAVINEQAIITIKFIDDKFLERLSQNLEQLQQFKNDLISFIKTKFEPYNLALEIVNSNIIIKFYLVQQTYLNRLPIELLTKIQLNLIRDDLESYFDIIGYHNDLTYWKYFYSLITPDYQLLLEYNNVINENECLLNIQTKRKYWQQYEYLLRTYEVEYEDPPGLLWLSVENDELDLLIYAFSFGININRLARDDNPLSGLLVAPSVIEAPILYFIIEECDYDMIEYLVNHGADVNFRLFYEERRQLDILTPLFLAIFFQRLKVAKLLLDHGANPNETDSLGNNYLCKVISVKSTPEIFELLLQYGVDPYNVNSSGFSCIILAVTNGHDRLVEILMKHKVDPNIENPNGDSLLHLATNNGYLKIVKILVKFGANINILNKDGNTPLIIAIKHKRHDIIQYLLSQGANQSIL